ncbi:MAG: hypothetical protein HY055_14790 [Magnetospirillum sp.]|nr:hypothetical protein [Magnetospirillum sp.]
MNRTKLMFVAASVMLAVNILVFVVQMIPMATASVDGMGYKELSRDQDFKKAVESVVVNCHVIDGFIYC